MRRRQLAAVVALVVGAATIALAVAVAVTEFPRGLGVLGCVVIAGAAAWFGVLRRGAARVAGLTVAALAVAGAVVLLAAGIAGRPATGRRRAPGHSGGSSRRHRRARRAARRGGAAPPGPLLQPALGRR